MKDSEVIGRNKRIVFLAVVTLGLAIGQSSATEIVPSSEQLPIGITAELDRLPSLTPMAVQLPYQSKWQMTLLDYEREFERGLAVESTIDPIDTGSIRGQVDHFGSME